MNLWHDIQAGKNVPEILNVIVETPRGSKNKFEIDKETGLIKLDRAMKTAQDFPFDYGFTPQTLWEDGDALDVVILTTYALSPGILVEVRPVGLCQMIDGGESDYKIISVPLHDPRWEFVKDIRDVNQYTLKEIKHFFETYKSIEGKKVEIKGFKGKKEALSAIKKAQVFYGKKFGKKE